MSKLSEQAARKIAVEIASGEDLFSTTESLLNQTCADTEAGFAKGIESIVATEYAPVMECLRAVWLDRRKLCTHHTNIQTGNYLSCLVCKGESPGGKPLVDEIDHADLCWVSRAQKIDKENS